MWNHTLAQAPLNRALTGATFLLLVAAMDTSRWHYESAIEIPPGATGIGVVRLTREVYAGARPDLADLRIVRNGEEVPYFIETLKGAVEDSEIHPTLFNQSVVPGRGLQVMLDL